VQQKPRLTKPCARRLVRLLWWFDVLEEYANACERSRAGYPPLVWEYAGETLHGLPQRPETVRKAMRFVRRLVEWKLDRRDWPTGWFDVRSRS
jgi:hypothetical protein